MNKERPILFNADMVRAILKGRKTQTRRIVKDKKALNIQNENGVWDGLQDAGDFMLDCCPYGKVGDVLWVREPAKVVAHEIEYHKSFVKVEYADGKTSDWLRIPQRLEGEFGAPPRWVYEFKGVPNGCIKEMARTKLEITGVRVERLQDISEEDAKKEGTSHWYGNELAKCAGGNTNKGFKYAFGELWERVYGTDSWNSNPWVWCISFEVRERTGG